MNAARRLSNLRKRPDNDKDLKGIYYAQMVDYIARGQVEVAPQEDSKTVFYLPHQAVRKVKKGRTNWRIVFDASSHERSAPSLNEVLEMGPNLLPETLAILLRFGLHHLTNVGDVTQAFLQLALNEDRGLNRFFWYRTIPEDDGLYRMTDEVIAYHFTRLPFGPACSPFVLAATLREHAERHKTMFTAAAP
jgi:hypothetical protein